MGSISYEGRNIDEISSSTEDESGVGGRSNGSRHGERNAWHDGRRRNDRVLERMGDDTVVVLASSMQWGLTSTNDDSELVCL